MGTNQDFNMVLVTESDDTLVGVYLCLSASTSVGYLSAKLSTESTYLLLKGPFNANCWLGDISASTSTTINFRLNVTSGGTEGLRNMVVFVGHDDGILPMLMFQETPTFWYDLDELAAVLWRDAEDFLP